MQLDTQLIEDSIPFVDDIPKLKNTIMALIKQIRKMDIIDDYDIIVDNPKKHIPWAIFCSTSDAYLYMQELKKERPKINWQMIKLDEWKKVYKGNNENI